LIVIPVKTGIHLTDRTKLDYHFHGNDREKRKSMSLIHIKIIPNAKNNEIVGKEGNAWKIRINAPPIEGRANEALVKFLAEILDVAPSLIEIVKGGSSKNKTIKIPLSESEVEEILK